MSYNMNGKRAVVTGGGGAILGAVARMLAGEGVSVAIWDLSLDQARERAEEARGLGATAVAMACDVTSQESIRRALDTTMQELGGVDVLVNGAGGSRPQTTTSDGLSFFDIDPTEVGSVMDLNYLSTVMCCQEVGRVFAEQGSGAVVNVTSIAGMTPLTRAPAYCNGKAAANSFTQWLAVHMVQNYSATIRVNAVAPGFVLTEQNRFLLIDKETGEMTTRGEQIMRAVPVARYGTPEEVAEVVVFLTSDRARFVNGAVIPVDGGFTAYSGV